MGEIRTYRDLKVWQEAMTLVEDCYRFAGEFPWNELYGLTSQFRRAAVLVPANIAEGSYIGFFEKRSRSLKELETHSTAYCPPALLCEAPS